MKKYYNITKNVTSLRTNIARQKYHYRVTKQHNKTQHNIAIYNNMLHHYKIT